MIKLLTHKDTYTIDYPQAIEFAEEQSAIMWFAEEIDMDRDLHNIKTELTESETYGVISTLKLFTLMELRVGDDYWGGFVSKIYNRPDIQRMANCFSFFEINVHAPFYNRINEILGLDTDEFYASYKEDKILNDRMNWIERQCNVKDKTSHYEILKSIGSFSLIEGAILYSSFAFLKHFQTNGKNKLSAVNDGINSSVADENLHSLAGAWLFKTHLQEAIAAGEITRDEIGKLKESLIKTAEAILEHESLIIGKIFEKGEMSGINANQLKSFVSHRLNLCLSNLNIDNDFEDDDKVIQKWFYKDLSSSKMHDFFAKQGSEYNRKWDKGGFVW